MSGEIEISILEAPVSVSALDQLASVLVAAHGNSLRALIMVLEKLTPEQILKRELATGAPVIYRLNADSTVASKVDLAA